MTISVTSARIHGAKVIQVAAFQAGESKAVFNLTTTTAEKARLLQDIATAAENPAARFDLIWTATSPNAGTLTIRLESSYNAASSKPSVSFLLSEAQLLNCPETQKEGGPQPFMICGFLGACSDYF